MYQNNEFTTEVTNYKPRRVAKKSKKPMLALALSFTILGSALGVTATTILYANTVTSGDTQYIYETIYSQSENSTTSLASSDNKTQLSASELYASNVDACVGIIVSNVSTNAFGQTSTTASSGSGFVITDDGYVVTNCHVIADAIDSDTITIDVSFYDGSSYPATLVGYEEDNDVAVLKIDGSGLQTIVLGDSDTLEVGEAVYAIGNPLGELTFTLTDGLISAVDRLISTSDGTTMNMFQTNTAINSGNSGGHLFNSAGEVVGITTAKYSTSSSGASVEGLGFAIPINDVVDILSDLMNYGYVTGKPYMSIQITNSQSGVAGAVVASTVEGGAADRAGLEVGDIITAIDDITIDSSSALTAAVTAYKAYDTVVLTVIRDDEVIYISVTFDEKNTTTESENELVTETYTEEQTMPTMPSMPSMPNMR